MKPFVHLHSHTEFSLLDGISRLPDMVRRAKELEQPALAITDHGNLYAAIYFYKECVAQGIKPVSYTHLDVYKRQSRWCSC